MTLSFQAVLIPLRILTLVLNATPKPSTKMGGIFQQAFSLP